MRRHYQEGGEVEGLGGPLSSLQELLEYSSTTTPEAQEAARGILDQYMSSMQEGYAPERELISQMQSQADEVREALRQARQRVLERRRPNAELFLAASAGLGQPTRSGAFGETMGNLSSALIPALQNRRQFDESQSAELLGIDQAMAGVDQNVLDAEMRLSEMQRQNEARMAQEALKTLGRRTTSGSGLTRQMRIMELAERFIEQGISPTQSLRRATDVVDGNVDIEVVEGLGVVRGTDKVNQTAWEIPIQSVEDIMGTVIPSPPGPQASTGDPRDEVLPGEMTLWDASLSGTGLWSALRQGYSIPAGWFGLPGADRTVKARQALRTETQELIRSFAINPRFLGAEQERIREELSLLPMVLDNPQDMRQRMISVDSSLRRRMRQAEADSQDVSLPLDVREAQESNAAAIRRFLPILGVPPNLQLGRSQEVPPELVDAIAEDRNAQAELPPRPGAEAPAEPPPEEVDPEALGVEIQELWPYWTDEERAEILELYGVDPAELGVQ